MKREAKFDADQKLIDGVTQYLGSFKSIPLGRQVLTPKEIVKVLEGRVQISKAARDADVARKSAIQEERRYRAQTEKTVAALRHMVAGMFLEAPDTLAAFGLKPRKTPTLDIETKRAAIAKAKATRAARHTLGPKQKQQIHGIVAAEPVAPNGQ